MRLYMTRKILKVQVFNIFWYMAFGFRKLKIWIFMENYPITCHDHKITYFWPLFPCSTVIILKKYDEKFKNGDIFNIFDTGLRIPNVKHMYLCGKLPNDMITWKIYIFLTILLFFNTNLTVGIWIQIWISDRWEYEK